jgi:DNA transposition AAA+ family ATPase
MGAWGYGPLENDTAMDYVSDVESLPAEESLEFLLKTINENPNKEFWKYDKIRAAIQIIQEKTKDKLIINKSIKKLKIILKDKSWIESWKDPYRIRKSIKEDINRLEKML